MNGKIFAERIGVSELICLIPAFIIISMTKGYSASYSVYALFGGALYSPGNSLIFMLVLLVPMLLLSYCVADYMQIDFAASCAYVFTRSASRARWLFRKAAGLLFYTAVFYTAEFCLMFLIFEAKGTNIDLYASLSIFAWTLLLNTLGVFLLLLPMNLLAIKCGVPVAYLICVGIYALLLIAAIYSPAARWLPVSQGIYAWHQTPWTAQRRAFSSVCLPNFSIGFSILYMIIAFVLEMGIGIVLIKRMDLLDTPKGDN